MVSALGSCSMMTTIGCFASIHLRGCTACKSQQNIPAPSPAKHFNAARSGLVVNNVDAAVFVETQQFFHRGASDDNMSCAAASLTPPFCAACIDRENCARQAAELSHGFACTFSSQQEARWPRSYPCATSSCFASADNLIYESLHGVSFKPAEPAHSLALTRLASLELAAAASPARPRPTLAPGPLRLRCLRAAVGSQGSQSLPQRRWWWYDSARWRGGRGVGVTSAGCGRHGTDGTTSAAPRSLAASPGRARRAAQTAATRGRRAWTSRAADAVHRRVDKLGRCARGHVVARLQLHQARASRRANGAQGASVGRRFMAESANRASWHSPDAFSIRTSKRNFALGCHSGALRKFDNLSSTVLTSFETANEGRCGETRALLRALLSRPLPA